MSEIHGLMRYSLFHSGDRANGLRNRSRTRRVLTFSQAGYVYTQMRRRSLNHRCLVESTLDDPAKDLRLDRGEFLVEEVCDDRADVLGRHPRARPMAPNVIVVSRTLSSRV